MDYIGKIREIYNGNIQLHTPFEGKRADCVPDEIYAILCVSNGIKETMPHPKTGKKAAVMWILYPHDMMVEETGFYSTEYHLEGVAFASDGAGNPYIRKPDGTIMCYNAIDDEETKISDTLFGFYGGRIV